MDGVPDPIYDLLVRQVYVAGQDASKWPDFLSSLSNGLGFLALALHTHDMGRNRNFFFLTHNYAPEFHASYQAYYARRNPWNEKVALAPVDAAISSPSLLAPDDLRRTEFYNDWIRPQGDIGTGAGITLYRDEGRFLRLSANIRFRDSDAVLEPLLRLLNRLGPHLRAAFDMSQVLSHARMGEAYRQAIAMADCAVFIVDRDGRPCLCNGKAEVLLRSGEYLQADRSQRLNFRDTPAQLAIDGFVAALREGRHPLPVTCLLRGVEAAGPASMKVAMLGSMQDDRPRPSLLYPEREAAAIITVSASTPRPSISSLEFKELFGLTGAELALVLHLAKGNSLRSFAEQRQVSNNTARSQMKSVLNKTGTERQGALVARVAGLIGPQA